MSRGFQSPETCPVCGAAVPPKARACSSCGADERTGWDDEKTRYDGLDLPEGSDGQDETPRAYNPKPRPIPKGVSLFWWLVGLLLVVVMATLMARGRF